MITAVVVIGILIAPTTEDAYLNSALIIASSAIGWVGGMMISPHTKNEEKKFSDLWKGITLFASGYLVSKIDPLLSYLFKPENMILLKDRLFAYRALASLSATVLTAIMAYVMRFYTAPMPASTAIRGKDT